MNKFLQTIVFFALSSAMVAFIFSAVRPAQYLLNSEFLVISDSAEGGCEDNLGSTLVRIINSESFHKDLEFEKLEDKVNGDTKIKVKNYKNSNIVNVKVSGGALVNTQKIALGVEKIILAETHKYYAARDEIKVKVLVSPTIIRTPKVILENSLKGLLGGSIFGFIVVTLTGFRVNIFQKKTQVKSKKENTRKSTKKKKGKQKNKNSEKYENIVKECLEKELTKESTGKLTLTEENYVFPTVKKTNQKVKDKKKKEAFKIRVISASTMIVGKQNKKILNDKAPDNLPVFTENATRKESYNHKSDISKKTIIKNKLKSNESVLKNKPTKAKKASAHDIANGFAPDDNIVQGPTNEEIKNRLNKLLRGEL